MICTNCGKGELQEITGTALLYCPICHSKLINPDAKSPDPWNSLTLREKEQVMQFLEDAAKVKKQFSPVPDINEHFRFTEWIGGHGPYWFYDEEKKHWIGTPHELPSTERLLEIWKKNIYPSLKS